MVERQGERQTLAHDAGRDDLPGIVDGRTTVEAMGQAIFNQILRHASGEKTKSEIDGIGENEFVPWPIGVLA